MNNIEKFYGNKYLDKQRSILSKMRAPKGIPYFLVGDSEAIKIRQVEFDKYLDLGFRHKIINKGFRSRLITRKWEVFFQALRELMCAYFIECILNYKISFYPKGSGNSVGEYLVEVTDKHKIFVEVKAPFKEIPDKVWTGNDSSVIKSNVKRARKQMPEDGINNLVIFAGNLRLPISNEASGIVDALYGEPIIKILVGPEGPLNEPESSFKPSGIFQPTANTRIGAVATLDDVIGSPYLDSCLIHVLSGKKTPVDKNLPMNSFNYVFKVYHNPYAKNPIDKTIFKGYPQFIPNVNTNRMEWIDTK